MDHLVFDKELFLSLKEKYNKAVEKGEETFFLKGVEIRVDYAKYIIQFLSPKFEN